MKIKIFCLCFCFTHLCIGQKSIIVKYISYQNTSVVNSEQEITLITDGDMAKQSIGIPSLVKGDYGAKLDDENKISIIEKPEYSNTNWFIFKDENKIVKSILVQSKHKVIHDKLPDYKWEILNEYDTIGNYQVIKAKTFFRGRTFIAWFAPSIPVGFGPWKLNGLPGLILKMYDENKLFLWHINSINLEAILTDSDFDIPKTKNDIVLTYQEAMDSFLKQQMEEAKRTNTKLMGRGGRFEYEVNTESRLEKVFEWELEEEKKD